MVPRAVVFDLGKVLLDFDYAIAARRIAARGRMTMAELVGFMVQTPLFAQYEAGRETTEQFYKEICAATGYSGTLDEFGAAFGDIFVAIEPMVELHAALRQRKIPTYVFSNTNDLAVRHIRRSFPFFAHFDGYVLSYEHGCMKPEPGLYEVLERLSGLRGPDLLYLDDRPENIAAGAARGWQVILHESPEKSRAIVAQLALLNHEWNS